jgi:hypothetical protein
LAYSLYTLLSFPIIIWQDIANEGDPVVVSGTYIFGAVLIVLAFVAITVLESI